MGDYDGEFDGLILVDGDWDGPEASDGEWDGRLDGGLDGGQILVPHEAPPEQKVLSKAESFLSHLQRFWLNAIAV